MRLKNLDLNSSSVGSGVGDCGGGRWTGTGGSALNLRLPEVIQNKNQIWSCICFL